ncbi:MAG: two-component sensor histidine kinase [Magnetococcales bacterium]|nr:two-component sensor histidine kinase [Magnetococcales bacterium]
MFINKPRSLSGQLVLILFVGVTASLVLSAAVHLFDRENTLFTVGGMQSAQRSSGVVRVLELIDPSKRESIANALNTPFQMTRILNTIPPNIRRTDPADERAMLVHSSLQDNLGEERNMGVTVVDTLATDHNGSESGIEWHLKIMRQGQSRDLGMVKGIYTHGISYIAQIQLADGQWVEFHDHLTEKVLTWPQHMLTLLIMLLVVVTGLSFVAVRLVTTPLTLLARAADGLGKNLNRPPLAEKGSMELQKAARAFNFMQARLSRLIQERMYLVAAISHDLKTPLTRIKLRAELLEDSQLGDNLTADLSEMEDMVSSTLDYIRGMESMEEKQMVDIPSILETLEIGFEDMGWPVRFEYEEFPAFPVMPRSFKRCLTNLIQNAVAYGDQAIVQASIHGNRLRITVADEGPGIPKEEMGNVFIPFSRLDTSRNRSSGGTGLGLSIARNIARAHGGDVKLRNRPEGGLEAILTLSAEDTDDKDGHPPF